MVGGTEAMVEVAGTFPMIARGDHLNFLVLPNYVNGKGTSKIAEQKAVLKGSVKLPE